MVIALVGPPAFAGDDRPVGRSVYVTNRGLDFFGKPGPHVVSQYVLGPTGELRSVDEPVAVGLGARGIVVMSDGRSAHTVAADEHAVYSYRIGARGELIPVGSVGSGGQLPFGLAGDPRGQHLYVANLGSSTVSVFSVDRFGRPTMRGEPVATGADNPRNAAVSPDGRFLFVSHGIPVDTDPDALVVFPIRPNGTLEPPRPPITMCAAGTGMAFTPDGTFLYLVCAANNNVRGFRVGPTGELTPVPRSPFSAPTTPEGIAITPDGGTAFVTSVASNPMPSPADAGVWTFTVEPDGSLALLRPRVDLAGGPNGPFVSPDGRHLYFSNFYDNSVTALDTATLRDVPGSPQPSRGMAPSDSSVVGQPNQGPRAAFTVRPRPRHQPTRFDATASRDSDGHIARYDWDFGDGTTLSDGGPQPGHNYRHPGRYQVTLVVTDNEGCSTTLIFTGRNALCTGSTTARTTHTVWAG